MVHSSMSYHVEGTAALSAEERARLRVYEGGAQGAAGTRSPRMDVRRASLALAAIVITVLIALGTSTVDSLREASANKAIDDAPKELVCVTSGDSLWSIAQAHPVRGASTKSVVSWIMAHNDLSTPALDVGDVLTVPMLQT